MNTHKRTWIIEVLLIIKTCSMAIVGISAIRIRLKAFAMAGSQPRRRSEMVQGGWGQYSED